METTSRFKLFLPGKDSAGNNGIAILSADIRPEKSTLAHFITRDGHLSLEFESEYKTKEFENFESIYQKFVDDHHLPTPHRLVVGIPGPVLIDKSSPVGIAFSFDREEIKSKTGIATVELINDLEATAYALAELGEESFSSLRASTIHTGNVAILAPGNGLGEAGLFYDGEYLRPFATEGGHSEFSPRTDVEVEFYQYLKAIHGIVSWECVLSNEGLFNIYRFLRDVKRHPESDGLAEKFTEGSFAEILCARAMEDNELICRITLDTFVEFLAREANSLVLKLKATGGLIISGDIPLAIRNYIDSDNFYRQFIISDKMQNLLQGVGIDILLNEKTITLGAAFYSAFHEIN